MPQVAVAIPKRLKLFGVTMAADRLSLLCWKTRVLLAEVFRLVRDYLLVHVGASCPLCINCVLKGKLCARAYTVLSCSRCLEPLIDGQGLCRACLVALRQASMDRWQRPRAA